MLKEKFINLPLDHKLLTREKIKGRDYYKYHDSLNHNINNYWAFKGVIQERINKVVLKFHKKKEAMLIDEYLFLPMASINIAIMDLKGIINELRRQQVQTKVIQKSKGSPHMYLAYGTLPRDVRGLVRRCL